MLRIRIVQFLQANVAARAMRVLEATMQAIVSHAIAITIARLLMQYGWNLGRQFIGMQLIGLLAVIAPQLIPAQDGRQFRTFRRRGCIKSWNCGFLLRHCPRGRCDQCDQKEKTDAE